VCSSDLAALLGFFGAKVLFAEALEPLERARIAARVGSVDRPDEAGTRVDEGSREPGPRAIACRRRVARVTVALGGLEERAVRRARLLRALAEAESELFALEEGPDEVVCALGESDALARVLQLADARASVERGLALVTVVGRGGFDFAPPPALAVWARPESLSLLVADDELEPTVNELHARCFEARAPSLA
jgi:aspartokinase